MSEVDPNLAVTSVRTMQEQVALTFDQQRAVASLAGLFGTVALLLAAVRMYGVTAYIVALRTREIGRGAIGGDQGWNSRRSIPGTYVPYCVPRPTQRKGCRIG